MKLLDLITKLQALYDSYDQEYRSVMGEPEIMIDVFRKEVPGQLWYYAGFDTEIRIEKSADGVYDIISGFENETN